MKKFLLFMVFLIVASTSYGQFSFVVPNWYSNDIHGYKTVSSSAFNIGNSYYGPLPVTVVGWGDTTGNAYLLTVIARQDSIWKYIRSDSLNTVQVDSTDKTGDNKTITYTQWVQWSFWADSTYETSFNNFVDKQIWTAGTSYTTKPMPISGHNILYMKKKSTYDGYMHRNIVAEGK